jgi:hypothetical protein
MSTDIRDQAELPLEAVKVAPPAPDKEGVIEHQEAA